MYVWKWLLSPPKRWFGLTLNAHLSTGCTSSMYKTTKSTCWKWRTILPNSRRSAINSGQEQEPKLTTKGLPGVWKSRSFRLAGCLSSRHSTGTLIAVPPGRAFFAKSPKNVQKCVFHFRAKHSVPKIIWVQYTLCQTQEQLLQQLCAKWNHIQEFTNSKSKTKYACKEIKFTRK